jgi:hypothetical protein
MLGHRRRVAVIAVTVCVLLLFAGFRLRRAAREIASKSGPPLSTPTSMAGDAARSSAPGQARSAAATPSREDTSSRTPASTADGVEERTPPDRPQLAGLADRAADDYRRLAQYPPWSHPFMGEDPILRDRHISPAMVGGPDGEDPVLIAFPDQLSFEAPEPVLLYAYLAVGGVAVPASSITATISSEAQQPLAALTFRDDGSDGDQIAGDYIYTARFDGGADFAPDLSESFLVRVVGDATTGEQRIAVTNFLYSNPHARLTGNYRDARIDGNLVVDAELDVLRAGRFYLQATLYDAAGRRGIGEAHAAAELPAGDQWMRLVFFGRVLAESGIDGPYLLRFVALATTTAMPNAKNRVVENAYVTAPYRAADFSDAPYDDPGLLDAAKRLEAR